MSNLQASVQVLPAPPIPVADCSHQTQCPQKRTFASSDRYMEQTVTVSDLALSVNMADRPKRLCTISMRSAQRSVKWKNDQRSTKICINKTLHKQKFVSSTIKFTKWDSARNLMSGVTMTVRGITFPLFDWEKKVFLPNHWKIYRIQEKIFFTVICIMLSSENCGLVGEMTLKYK